MRKMYGLLVFVSVLSTPNDALAYIDPSSGGLLIQMLLGGIAGIGVLVKLYWAKLTKPFRKNENREN